MAGQNRTSVFIVICVMLYTSNVCQSARINRRQADANDIPTEISDIIPMVGPDKMVDLALIFDVSKSISKELLYLRSSPIMKSFIRNFVTLHKDYARLAVAVFDNTARVAIDDISSNQGITKCQLYGGDSESLWIKNITWSGIAGTNVLDALSLIKEIMSTGRANRPGVTQVTIILTDGSYGSNDPVGAATALKNDGVTIFTAGLGNWLQTNNVRILGSKDAYFGNEDDWIMLSKGSPSYDAEVRETLARVDYDLCRGTCNNGLCQCHINTGISECQCEIGYTWDGTNCTAVAVGTYKDSVGNQAATQCPGKMSTPSIGATSLGDCFCPNEILATECDDQCEPNPCTGSKNVCIRLADGNHECICPPGYEGTDCTTNSNNCANMPCATGTCIDLLDDYMCNCLFGYQGKNCEIDYDECQIGFCENSGVCTDEVPNNFKCTCDIGWKGRYCIDRNEVCDNCLNNGTCVVVLENGLGVITCDCPEQYTGELCESEITTTPMTAPFTTINTEGITTQDFTPSSTITTPQTVNRFSVTTKTGFVAQYLSTTVEAATAQVATQQCTRNSMDALTLGLIIGGVVLSVLILSVTVIVVAVLRNRQATKETSNQLTGTHPNGGLNDVASPIGGLTDVARPNSGLADAALDETYGQPNYTVITSEPDYEFVSNTYERPVVSNTYERPDPAGREQYENTAVYQGLQEL